MLFVPALVNEIIMVVVVMMVGYGRLYTQLLQSIVWWRTCPFCRVVISQHSLSYLYCTAKNSP